VSAGSYRNATKWLCLCLIFTPTLNDNDVRYNLFVNVKNILYTHTVNVLLIYYKDAKNKRTDIHATGTDLRIVPVALVIVCNHLIHEYEMFCN
jgi:hypothetical protein